MAETDSGEGFKVRDRRRLAEADEAPREPGPERPRAAASEAARVAEPVRPPAPPEPRAEAAPTERNLGGLFMMLASSAVIAMGEAPDPLSGQVHRDLAQATEVIDLMLLLREKTEGNRTAEETQMLDDLIYDLQLRYVSAARRSG